MRIGIIGAGASGLMAAYAASEKEGSEVLLFDKNPMPGKKLLRTGNGRCNFLNKVQDVTCFNSSNPERVKETLSNISSENLLSVLLDMGIVPTLDHDDYYYPMSDQAKGVVKCMTGAVRARGVRILGGKEISSVRSEDGGFVLVTDGYEYRVDRVIVCCGGLAAPDTGCDGSGYRIMSGFGHKVTDTYPALSPLIIADDPLKKAAGTRVSAQITYGFYSCDGELQITDYGISGIAVFQLSRHIAKDLASGKTCKVHIRFFPEYPDEGLGDIVTWLLCRENITIEERLAGLIPEKLCSVLLDRIGLDGSQKGQVTEDDYKNLLDLLLDYEITIEKVRGFDKCQVTAGGVSLMDIDPDTMESNICPGLYACGELLDVDGICGGYNLQWAFTTGLLAGISAANENIQN